MKRTAIIAAAFLLAAGAAQAQMAPAKPGDTPKGKALGGKSACSGPCAENWPPLLASDSDKNSGDWTIVSRDDGKKMWAYKGRPLYAWKNDKAPGDADGDGKLNGAWHIATP